MQDEKEGGVVVVLEEESEPEQDYSPHDFNPPQLINTEADIFLHLCHSLNILLTWKRILLKYCQPVTSPKECNSGFSITLEIPCSGKHSWERKSIQKKNTYIYTHTEHIRYIINYSSL